MQQLFVSNPTTCSEYLSARTTYTRLMAFSSCSIRLSAELPSTLATMPLVAMRSAFSNRLVPLTFMPPICTTLSQNLYCFRRSRKLCPPVSSESSLLSPSVIMITHRCVLAAFGCDHRCLATPANPVHGWLPSSCVMSDKICSPTAALNGWSKFFITAPRSPNLATANRHSSRRSVSMAKTIDSKIRDSCLR